MAYGEQQEFATINRVMTWWSALISVVLLCFPLAVVAGVPNPNVTGPIPANAPPGDASHDYPQTATSLDPGRPLDLTSLGYVEEEYFFSGTANVYSTPTLVTERSCRAVIPISRASSSAVRRHRHNSTAPSSSNG